MSNTYQIYLISDSTGETLDRIFLALKAHFLNIEYKVHSYSFTRTENQILKILEDAKKTNPDIGLGEFIIKELPPIELGRVAAQNAKGVIIQKVREADKSKDISDLEEEIGDVLFSVVNLARHLKLDSEELLRRANSKFINRFKAIEKELVKRKEMFKKTK